MDACDATNPGDGVDQPVDNTLSEYPLVRAFLRHMRDLGHPSTRRCIVRGHWLCDRQVPTRTSPRMAARQTALLLGQRQDILGVLGPRSARNGKDTSGSGNTHAVAAPPKTPVTQMNTPAMDASHRRLPNRLRMHVSMCRKRHWLNRCQESSGACRGNPGGGRTAFETRRRKYGHPKLAWAPAPSALDQLQQLTQFTCT